MVDHENPFGVREEIRELSPYQPGMSEEALRRERGVERVVKLGSNESSWGPLPGAAAAISEGIPSLNRYPDGAFFDLRTRLADIAEVSPTKVVLGNGADSILINLSLAMLDPGDEVVHAWPSFITYPLSVKKTGATSVPVPLTDTYTHDLPAMRAAVTDKTRMIYICNPNNPTGTHVDIDDLNDFIASVPSHILIVIDEAYHEFVTDAGYPDGIADFINAGYNNVMVLRTFSKIFGLAGIRVGWAVAPVSIVHAIDTVRGPFELNALANRAALASLGEIGGIRARIDHNEHARLWLTDQLSALGLSPIESSANFVCVPLPEAINAAELCDQLMSDGLIVRPLAMFGMPEGIRITVGTDDENQFAVTALKKVLAASQSQLSQT